VLSGSNSAYEGVKKIFGRQAATRRFDLLARESLWMRAELHGGDGADKVETYQGDGKCMWIGDRSRPKRATNPQRQRPGITTPPGPPGKDQLTGRAAAFTHLDGGPRRRLLKAGDGQSFLHRRRRQRTQALCGRRRDATLGRDGQQKNGRHLGAGAGTGTSSMAALGDDTS